MSDLPDGDRNHLSRRAALQLLAGGSAAVMLPRPLFAATPVIVADTSGGQLRGISDNGVKAFLGVQYGAPPTGKGRFKPARAAQWPGIRDARTYGNCALQARALQAVTANRGGGISLEGENPTFDENCLYLNVWTPAVDSNKRPVLVWLHGGGFATGSGGSLLYDGANMARTQDVVVLTINHRLNVFGHLDLSQIAGQDYKDSASVGMLDAVLALQWVKQNISRFGGDPDNVTVFGESGGGRKVSVLMAMPAAQGLFQRAVVESGSALRMDTPEVGHERAEKLLAALQLKPAEFDKLLTLPGEALLQAINAATAGTGQFRPTTGAPSLPAHPFDPAAPAISARVPMLIGTNFTEASFALGRDPRVLALDEAGVLERVKALVPPQRAAAVLATYKRLYPRLQPSDWLFRLVTDRGYFLDSTIQAGRKADQKAAPAFLYSFNWEQPLSAGRTHVPHGSEVAFVFNNVGLARGANPEKLAATMCGAWAAFARTGNPSTKDIGTWQAYDSAKRPTMLLDKECRMENDPRSEQRKLMLSFGSQQFAGREIAPM